MFIKMEEEFLNNYIDTLIENKKDTLKKLELSVAYSASKPEKYDITDYFLYMVALNIDTHYEESIIREVAKKCKTKTEWKQFEKRVREEEKKPILTEEVIDNTTKRCKAISAEAIKCLYEITSYMIPTEFRRLRILYNAAKDIEGIKERLIVEALIQCGYADAYSKTCLNPSRLLSAVLNVWMSANSHISDAIHYAYAAYNFTDTPEGIETIIDSVVEARGKADKDVTVKFMIDASKDGNKEMVGIMDKFSLRTIIREIPIPIALYYAMLDAYKLEYKLKLLGCSNESGSLMERLSDLENEEEMRKYKEKYGSELLKDLESAYNLSEVARRVALDSDVLKCILEEIKASPDYKIEAILYILCNGSVLTSRIYRCDLLFLYTYIYHMIEIKGLEEDDCLNLMYEVVKSIRKHVNKGKKAIEVVKEIGIEEGLREVKTTLTLSDKLQQAQEEIGSLREQLDTYDDSIEEANRVNKEYNSLLTSVELERKKVAELTESIKEYDRMVGKYKRTETELNDKIAELSTKIERKEEENKQLRGGVNRHSKYKQIPIKCYVNILNKHKIALVGGDKMYPKLKEYGLNIRTFRSGTHNFGHQELSDMELIVVATKQVDHCMHYIVRNEKERGNTKIMYFNGKYTDFLILDMVEQLYS